MLMVISPAKTLDFETPAPTQSCTQPELLAFSAPLIERLRQQTPAEIAALMKISDKLAQLNVARYASWSTPFTLENAKQALFAFQGDVYTGLDAASLNDDDLAFAQQHLRMLSGLYGVLRPLDLMQPYRLEMGIRLSNDAGPDLYHYWDNRITEHLNATLAEQQQQTLINLASNEYFKAVRPRHLEAPIITPVFKDYKNGQYKIISFYAKKARGMMARYIIQHRIDQPEAIKHFDLGGYRYSAELSQADQWVFIRDASNA